jgi:hypothetical protein
MGEFPQQITLVALGLFKDNPDEQSAIDLLKAIAETGDWSFASPELTPWVLGMVEIYRQSKRVKCAIKSGSTRRRHREILANIIVFMVTDGITRNAAFELVANKYEVSVQSIEKWWKNPDYRVFKELVKAAAEKYDPKWKITNLSELLSMPHPHMGTTSAWKGGMK